eukprot:tig00001239_g7756.t1
MNKRKRDDDGDDAESAASTGELDLDDIARDIEESLDQQQNSAEPAIDAGEEQLDVIDNVKATLDTLPTEIAFKILTCLDYRELVALSGTCRALRSLATTDALWTGVYRRRWPDESFSEAQEQHRKASMTWRRLFSDRYAAETADFRREAAEQGLSPRTARCFREMDEMRRASAGSPEGSPGSDPDEEEAVIQEWRRAHPKQDPRVAAGHACSGAKCRVRCLAPPPALVPLYVCEGTGRVHRCGRLCDSKTVSEDASSFVCTISGSLLDDYYSDGEDFGGPEVEGGREATADEAANDWSGFLRKAYIFGYGCDTEKELDTGRRS